MLCSRRGMHPMDCRLACDLSVVRHHRIYRKLSGDMLGACASAMTVSDCPHGQEKKILQRKLSPKMPPHGAFQPNPHHEATVRVRKLNQLSALIMIMRPASRRQRRKLAALAGTRRGLRGPGAPAHPLGHRRALAPGQTARMPPQKNRLFTNKKIFS